MAAAHTGSGDPSYVVSFRSTLRASSFPQPGLEERSAVIDEIASRRHNLHASWGAEAFVGMSGCIRRSGSDGIGDMVVEDCELCRPENLLLEGSVAYVRYDNNSLSPGHVLVVPRRHVASYFDMTVEEKAEMQSLLDRAQAKIAADRSPDGYNIGVNVGQAAGQNRMHVHVHLIPRYSGDVRDPSGGIRCVLSKT